MQPLRHMVDPVGRVALALRRPGTYAGHVREVASTVVTMGMWPLGFADQALSDRRGRESGSVDSGSVATPVLLLHGYGANRSNWWILNRHLRAAGFDRIHAVNYNPLAVDLPHLSAQCVRRIAELKDHFGVDRVHVVGHSLGGIIARYAVQVLGATGVDTVVTVASPHGGVRLARFASAASDNPFSTSAQLRPDSPEMVLLRSSVRPMATRFVSYYSNLDMVVTARRAMILEPELDATNLLIKDHGHLSILLSGELGSSLVGQLRLSEQLAAAGAVSAPTPAHLANKLDTQAGPLVNLHQDPPGRLPVGTSRRAVA
jgi:triacylglycerol lipase